MGGVVEQGQAPGSPGYEFHRAPGARTLLVTFGSFVNAGRPHAPYAFMDTVLRARKLTPHPLDVLYLVANANDWYMGGIRGLGASADEALPGVLDLCSRYDRTIFMGNSMGAYAALHFGARVGASRIVAFSPQTRFDREFCDSIGEKRWAEARESMQARFDIARFDLRNVCAGAEARIRAATIYVGANERRDLAYADHVRDIPGITVKAVEDGSHELVYQLRASGDLERIVVAVIEETAG